MAHSRNPVRGGVLSRAADGGLIARLDLPDPRPALVEGAELCLVTASGARWSWPYALAEGEELTLRRAPARAAEGAHRTGSADPSGARASARVSAGPGVFELILSRDELGPEEHVMLEIVGQKQSDKEQIWRYPEAGWVELP